MAKAKNTEVEESGILDSNFLEGLHKQLKKGVEGLQSFSELDLFKSQQFWIPTGSPSLDYRLNTLGIPVGVTEIRGPSRGGKTTLGLHCIKSTMEIYPDAICVILSTERRDNKEYAAKIGVDTNRVMVAKCKTIEDVFNKTFQIINSVEEAYKKKGITDKPKFVFLWDSLGASISAQEKRAIEKAVDEDDEDGQGKAAMAAAARAIKRGFRALQGEVYDKNIWFIFINHTYDKIGGFGEGQASYGGKAVEYMPSMRLNVSYISQVKIREVKKGQISYVKVVKSDFGSDLSEIELEIFLGRGFILNKGDIEIAVSAGILEPNGKNGYSFMDGKLKWDSKPELYDLYEENHPLIPLLIKKIQREVHRLVCEKHGVISEE